MEVRAFTQFGRRVALIIGVLLLLVSAYLVRGAETGTTFATGSGQAGLELKIDSEASYNGVSQPQLSWSLKDLVPGVDKFWNFDDVKPGDNGENTISIHIKKNPAWVCLNFLNLVDAENSINEPESLVDVTSGGDLSKGLEFFAWHDDGDNVFELGEKPIFGTSTQDGMSVLSSTTYPLADSTTGGPYGKDSTHYFGVTWCAGDLDVNLTTAAVTCDGTALGNEAQTDSMSVDVSLTAVQATANSRYICGGGNDRAEGCSPGYWKQPHHFGNWPAPYATTTLFGSVFENAFPGKTLLQVLSQGGGGLNALGRQVVAALLNASSTNYAYSATEVIAMFNAVYPGGDYETLKAELEYQNTVYCPLGRDDESKRHITEWKHIQPQKFTTVVIEKCKSAWKRLWS
jgi:hypothetical protein